MRTGSARVWSSSLLGCVLVIAGVGVGGCKKESDEPLVQESETANAAPTPAMEATPMMTTQVAAAQLSGPGGVGGVVSFTQEAGDVHVVAKVQGAKPGSHGIHLHAGGVCEPPDFKSAGDHFNPTGAPHGGPDAAQHHAGDFGNIEVGTDGNGQLDLTTTMLSVGDGGPGDVVGKAVILHGGQDDLTSQPSGNAGPRVACGVVQLAPGEAAAGAAEPPMASSTPQY